MQNKHFFIILLFLFSQSLTAQKNYIISGYIEDESSGERLIGAAIYDSTARFGTVTNNYGYFNLSNAPNLPIGQAGTEGPTYLRISYIGYQTERITLNIRGDTTLNIKLSTKNTLQAVEVNAQKQDRIEDRVQMSQVTIPIEQIKRMPMILGEADVLKSLQFLPGVKAGTEGTSGLYVRGGSSDQNLIILDGVPIYNAAHIGGLFSVFNTDAIKSVSLIKGGFPARFGGRLSSVVEISMKDGNKKEFHGNFTIGLLTSKLTLEGPIIKDKLSYMLSARRTYFDWIFASALTNKNESNGIKSVNERKINFYDFNAKLHYAYNDKHNFYFSLYKGNDVYGTNESTLSSSGSFSYLQGFDYGNTLASLRWNWLPKPNLFINSTIAYSSYAYEFEDRNRSTLVGKQEQKSGLLYISNVKDISLKSDGQYTVSQNYHIRFGGGIILHRFQPSETTISQTNERDTLIGAGVSAGTEYFGYIENEFKYGKLIANLGLHAVLYNVKGKNFFSLQPRISLNYPALEGAIKTSFTLMNQNLHLLTNDALGLPTDSWVPAVPVYGPQKSTQIALGYAKTLKGNVEFSIEGYYKEMDNLVAYKEGTSFLTQDPDWEKKVVQGKGTAYGFELFLQKNEGKNTGMISYTLSWNNRQFEEINNGESFPYKFDRRHEFAIVYARHLNKKVTFSANWTFATGNAITIPNQIYSYFLPNGEFSYAPVEQFIYGNRNSYRTKIIQRLDIGFEFLKKRIKYERRWNVGLYNVYNYSNPFYYFIRNEYNSFIEQKDNVFIFRSERVVSLKQAGLLPILPYVSYSLKF
jgi:TonB-dependent Receptor Plug Domain/CarboxypepD_reg-like domain